MDDPDGPATDEAMISTRLRWLIWDGNKEGIENLTKVDFSPSARLRGGERTALLLSLLHRRQQLVTTCDDRQGTVLHQRQLVTTGKLLHLD